MIRIFVGLVSLALVALLARQPPSSVQGADGRLVLPRPELLRALGRSHLQLVTDFYWLRAINRSFSVMTPGEGAALLALGNLIADLDPKLNAVYWAIGMNAPVPPEHPGEVWPGAGAAADLIERGIVQFPLDNRLTIALIINMTTYQRDYLRAAKALQARAKLPDPLPTFGPLATRLLAAGGAYEASREFAREMLASATDDDTRKLFEERLRLIDLEEELANTETAAKKYLAETGEQAKDVATLLRAGYLTHLPQDPFGGAIILRDGRAYSTAVKRLEFLTSPE